MFKIVWLVLVVVLVIAFPFISNWLSSGAFGLGSKQVEKQIEDYINENPDKILKSLQEHHEKEMKLRSAQHNKDLIRDNKLAIYDARFPHFGNDMSLPAVVEFSNYMCSHCKTMDPIVKKFIENEVLGSKQRAVYFFRTLAFPNAPQGDFLAKASLAVNKLEPSKFLQFHSSMMQASDYSNEAILAKVKELGINEKAFNECISSSEIEGLLKENIELAIKLGINGTPAFLVGDQVLMGSQPYDNMVSALDSLGG